MSKFSSDILADAGKFIERFCSVKKVVVDCHGAFTYEGNKLTLMEMHDRVILAWRRCFNCLPPVKGKGQQKPFTSHAELKSALRVYGDAMKAKAEADFRMQWVCVREDLTGVIEFIKALTGETDPLSVAVMAHWIASVKRKILGLPVEDHLLPILYAKQGAGKTVAVRKLLEPLAGFTVFVGHMSHLVDERRYRIFSTNYVAFCDELVWNYSKSDIKAFNAILTSEYLTYRLLGSHEEKMIKQNCMFIATTDTPVALQIHDPAGMRRFYEIACSSPLNWGALNKVDYDALWRGVNEERNYISEKKDNLREIQKSLEGRNGLVEFLDCYDIKPVPEKEGVPLLFKELYKHYAEFCLNAGLDPEGKVWVGRKLTAMGYPKRLRREATVGMYYYLNAGHSLPGKKTHLSVVAPIDVSREEI